MVKNSQRYAYKDRKWVLKHKLFHLSFFLLYFLNPDRTFSNRCNNNKINKTGKKNIIIILFCVPRLA